MRTQGDLDRRVRVEALAVSSNVALPGEEQDAIHELIAEVQEELDRPETALRGASRPGWAALDTRTRRHTEEIKRITSLRVGIAAHKRLPPELLAAIFVHCQQGYVVSMCHRHVNSLPWALCQICSRWREIALAEPQLWSFIHLPPRFSHSTATMELIHRILSCHGGAGKVALTVRLRQDKDWTTLLDLVSTYSSRVSGLRLIIIDAPSPHFDYTAGVFDALETLTITDDYDKAGETLIAAFTLARNLRKLRINSKHSRTWLSSTWPQRIPFPWTTLTELNIATISPKATLEVLAQCMQILRLVVTFDPDETPHRGTFEPVSLPQLYSLHITPNEITNLTEFLDALVLTRLKALTFGPGISEPWPQKTILNLLSHSSHTMESFETSDFITPGDCILPLLRALPHLTELSVCIEDPISERDLLTMTSENVAPKLRVVKDWEASSYRAALDFLNSRWSRDDQGRYDGIRDAKFWTPRINMIFDTVNFHRFVSQMQTDGRVVVAQDY